MSRKKESRKSVFVVLMESMDTGQNLVMGVFTSLAAVDKWKEEYLQPEDDEPIVEEHYLDE